MSPVELVSSVLTIVFYRPCSKACSNFNACVKKRIIKVHVLELLLFIGYHIVGLGLRGIVQGVGSVVISTQKIR